MEDKIYYERNLPHFQPRGATFFLTYRLYGSLPKSFHTTLKAEIAELEEATNEKYIGHELAQKRYNLQKKVYQRYDSALDSAETGPLYLAQHRIAQQVADSLHDLDGEHYELLAYCIMSNHVHVLFRHLETAPLLHKILQSHKGYTARKCNKTLGRGGTFWQKETYDHVVRNTEEQERIVEYILQNPVKAGLCKSWGKWAFTYVKEGLLYL